MNHPQADPPLPPQPDGTLGHALRLVRFLRARCEWDAAQTPASLVRYLLEEAHEAADAIRRGDDADLRDELGDLLLNVCFQLVLADERGAFTTAETVQALHAKMARRHPHLFGLGEREPWERIKARERAGGDRPPASVLDGLERDGDTLIRARRLQARVAAAGFDWPGPEGALVKVAEEVEEVREHLGDGDTTGMEEEIGDLLFSVVNVARLCGVDASAALAAASSKFTSRFRQLETSAREQGVVIGEAGLDELDALWDEVKEAQ